MHSSGCVSRRDRIISGQSQLKRLSAARLHRKTDVIPDYNVTARFAAIRNERFSIRPTYNCRLF